MYITDVRFVVDTIFSVVGLVLEWVGKQRTLGFREFIVVKMT